VSNILFSRDSLPSDFSLGSGDSIHRCVPYTVESPPELIEHSRSLAARIASSVGSG
jgi:hypothetical protein